MKEISMKERKTALVLGGGGSRGAYEIGVWQALRELGIKIDMVFGTSVGSINGALIAQDDFDLAVMLWREITTGMIFDIDLPQPKKSDKTSKTKLIENVKARIADSSGISIDEAKAYAKEIIKNGGASAGGLSTLLDKYLDEETIKNSDMEYGLITVQLPNFVPTYLYKEDIASGKLRDFIIASSTVAPAIKKQVIDGKEYIDGGFYDSIPVSMALEKGATDIIAVDLQAIGVLRHDDLMIAQKNADSFTFISSAWDMGNMLIFDTKNSRKLIRLGYLDAMKTYGVFAGHFYTFPRGEFDKKTLHEADCAAKIFGLDPSIIYRKGTLDEYLTDAIKDHKKTMKKDFRFGAKVFTELAIEALDAAQLISKKISRQTLTILLAEELIKNPDNSLISSRAAKKLLKDELTAASYLIKHNLI